MELPDEWKITNDWNSHRSMIYTIINLVPHDCFFEFGMGDGSTPLLVNWYSKVNSYGKEFYSFESSQEWLQKYNTEEYVSHFKDRFINKNHCIVHIDGSYLDINLLPNCILFIDCAPAEIRKEIIKKQANDAKVIIVHDSEDGAEYIYGLKYVLSTFKYRLDYKPEGMPQTTAVSNFIDVSKFEIAE